MRLTVSAVSNVSCVHTATPQTLVYIVNATSCVVSKMLALKELGDGREGVRSLLAGLTNFLVLEFFVATKLSLCHSPFPPSGTVLRANLHVPTCTSSLCSTTLKLKCLHVVTCLVFSPCVRSSTAEQREQYGILGSLPAGP